MSVLRQFVLLISILGISACAVNYSFTGISTDAKTVSVLYFRSYAALAPPTYSQLFSESMKDIFLQQTNLDLVAKNGQLQFEGEVVDYKTQPVGITGNETAALNRLSITVNVRFVNTLNEKDNFEQRFTRYEDYESNQSLSDVEDALIDAINQQLTQDILNKAIGDW